MILGVGGAVDAMGRFHLACFDLIHRHRISAASAQDVGALLVDGKPHASI